MYKIYMEYYKDEEDEERTRSLISGKTFDMQLIDPSADLALNKAGKAEFTVPAQHPYYKYIKPMITNIEIFDIVDGQEISVFFGRIANVNRGWNNQKKVTCEGAFAFFNDTIQRYKKYASKNTTLLQFFNTVISKHNDQITDESRKIYVGTVELKDPDNPTDPSKNIENKKVYRLTNYETTLDVLTEMCLESEGGYMFIRRELQGDGSYRNYLDWVNRLDTDINQPAKFGLNLTDINQDFDPDDLYTALMPLGADYDKYVALSSTESGDNPYEKGWYENSGTAAEPNYVRTNDTTVDNEKTYYEQTKRPKTIKSYTPSPAPSAPYSKVDDYIQNTTAVSTYGFILKVKRWDDVNKKADLYKKALQWMKTERFDKLVINCDVADLSNLQPEYEPFMMGKVVRIISPPHGITNDDPILLPISEIHYDLNTGKKDVTIGTQPQVTLSRITKKGGTKEVRLPDAIYDSDTGDDEE